MPLSHTYEGRLHHALCNPLLAQLANAQIIGAWNFPILLCVAPLIAAISAGCPAIIKVSCRCKVVVMEADGRGRSMRLHRRLSSRN